MLIFLFICYLGRSTTLIQKNFLTAAHLGKNAALCIQVAVQLLEDNTSTRIMLKNPQFNGNIVDFDLIVGELLDVDNAFNFSNIER